MYGLVREPSASVDTAVVLQSLLPSERWTSEKHYIGRSGCIDGSAGYRDRCRSIYIRQISVLDMGTIAWAQHGYPRGASLKKDIVGAFYRGMKHRPDSTFGRVDDDVLENRDPNFKRADFCSIILQSSWRS